MRKTRDVTGGCDEFHDRDGDTLVVYTPAIGLCAIGTQRRTSRTGFAVVLDAAALDAAISALQERRKRMP